MRLPFLRREILSKSRAARSQRRPQCSPAGLCPLRVRRVAAVALLSLVSFRSGELAGETYVWVDEAGVTHLTDGRIGEADLEEVQKMIRDRDLESKEESNG